MTSCKFPVTHSWPHLLEGDDYKKTEQPDSGTEVSGHSRSHLTGACVGQGIVLIASEAVGIVFCLLLDCLLSRHVL